MGSQVAVVLIGGLTDGLLTVPYAQSLSSHLELKGIALVQLLMPSSYKAYGISSLAEDARHIRLLLEHLRFKMHKEKVILLGHSTGCQDIMRLFEDQSMSHLVQGAVLQAPVSDRENLEASHAGEKGRLLKWVEMGTTLPDSICSRLFGGAPISAFRAGALLQRLGDDDYFSTDLSVDERRSKLAAFPVPLLAMLSECDEYFPMKERLPSYGESLKEAWGAQVVVLKQADHGINRGLPQFLGALDEFIAARCM